VTKYAGGVAKGFAIVAGIVVTAFVTNSTKAADAEVADNTNLFIAGGLVATSIYLQATGSMKKSPPTPSAKKTQ
jgi:hypothetical protein